MRRLAILLLLIGCTKAMPPSTKTAENTEATTATQAPAPVASGPRVIFPDGFVVNVEIAADPETRAQGLMYRDHLGRGAGMLFFFPESGEYPFWMKNTRIPLDMIWIDANHRVAHVKHEVPPCRIADCPSYAPNAIAQYILEVDGGVARQHGLKAGDAVRFEGTENVVAR
ncbi:MAG TPA: DUF192 domain-containing protein [Thermoanaerobaculia bacterium]|nr:DUF192 domain-containing protein [Thermoanaerobaculia bacterium]